MTVPRATGLPFGCLASRRGRQAAALSALIFAASLTLPNRIAAAEAYQLQPGDKIIITVFGQPDLSGDFTLDGSGNVLMPLAGSIPAAGDTLSALEAQIRARLADGYLKDPKVSIRISELRPIFVTGDVKAAGSFPFRYGMTVLSAIALAGGPGISSPERAMLQGEFLQAEQRLEVLVSSRRALVARRVRLSAERDNASTLRFPDGLIDARDRHLTQLLTDEQEVFESRRQAQRTRIELLRQEEPRLAAQLEAVATQLRLEQKQHNLLVLYQTDLLRLAKEGLTTRSRLIEMQRDQVSIEANIARLRAQAAQAVQEKGNVQRRIEEAQAAYRRQVVGELQEVNSRLMETAANLRAAHDSLELLQARGAIIQTATRQGRRISILRSGKNGLQVIPADETTPLRPGDIVRVGGGADESPDTATAAFKPRDSDTDFLPRLPRAHTETAPATRYISSVQEQRADDPRPPVAAVSTSAAAAHSAEANTPSVPIAAKTTDSVRLGDPSANGPIRTSVEAKRPVGPAPQTGQPDLSIHFRARSPSAEQKTKRLEKQLGARFNHTETHRESSVPARALIRYYRAADHSKARVVANALSAMGYSWSVQLLRPAIARRVVDVWIPDR